MGILSHLEPKEVFTYFEEICSIPRASYHEEKISDYCAAFAKSHNLTCYQDDLKNIIIIKEAAPGYENEAPVIIQGHLDMVCEKESGCTIDFDTDGLKLMIEGDYITADGTTLGGDDGIAVAYALALLASDTIPHPKLEAVFTVSEEVGMEGARGIDLSMLEGRRLINLDSENEGAMMAGCAGGAGVECTLPLRTIDASGSALKITVTGLAGGHSGVEIDKGRANANILMGRILISLSKQISFYLAAFEGGGKDNAIPRKCSVCVCMAAKDIDKAEWIIAKIQQDISREYAVTDKDIKITAERDVELPFKMADKAGTRKAVMLVNALPNGIQAMSADVEGLVETSLNLGILKLEGSQLRLQYSVRSSIGSAKEALLDKLTYLVREMGGMVKISGDYPAWEYRRGSAFREKLATVYERMYGKKLVIEAVHAGVECGFLTEKIEGLDCVSIGPDMQSIHTTDERLSISSTKRVWEYLLEILKTKD